MEELDSFIVGLYIRKELINYRILCYSYWSIRMLAINAGKEASALLNLVIKNTQGMLPNQFLTNRQPDCYYTMKYPRVAYFVWRLLYGLKYVSKKFGKINGS